MERSLIAMEATTPFGGLDGVPSSHKTMPRRRQFTSYFVAFCLVSMVLSTARALAAREPLSSSSSPNNNKNNKCVDVLIIGGGVVGCAVARAATLAGYSCAIVEREAHVLHWASGSNSGIACTGVDATPGTLERALIRDSIAQLPAFLREMGIPHDACGSLVCQWPWNNNEESPEGDIIGLQQVLAESHEAGDVHAQHLTTTRQVLNREPNLNPSVQSAVHIPGEIVVDPWLYSIALLVQARANGCVVYTNTAVDPSQISWNGQQWTIPVFKHDEEAVTATTTSQPPKTMYARSLVCATGAWAADWEQALSQQRHNRQDDNSKTAKSANELRAAPRRGQYRIYQAQPTTRIRHPIQPIPTQRTKGIFVFGSLYDQIIVGPTALDQTSKTDRSIDPQVATDLDQFAQRILPNLDPTRDFVGEYVGIRPGTNQRDYQIRAHFAPPWINVAGIRSTGLTASLGIGRHVTYLLEQILREKHDVVSSPLKTPVQLALPPLPDLIREFRERGDGCVEIHGHVYKVTHPISYLGWKHQSN